MTPDPWLDYSGPLCDCPGERAGEQDPEPDRADERGLLWEELAPAEREYLSRTAMR